MLIADGGGGWPRTDWSKFDMPALWAHISGQMPPGSTSTAPHWDHVSGWRKAIELASLNKYRIEALRDDIMQVWPTDRSPAAAAYVNHLNELIDSLNQVYEHSVKNYEYSVSMVSTLASTTHLVKELYDKWVAKQALINNLEANKDGAGAGKARKAAIDGINEDIRTAEGEQATLVTQARAEMNKLSTDLNAARTYLQPPPVYKAPMLRSDASESGDGGGGGGSGGGGSGAGMNPPVIPPVVPTPAPPPAPGPAYKAPIMVGGPDLSGVAPSPVTSAPAPGIGGLPTAPGGGSSGVPLAPGMPGVIGGAPGSGAGPGGIRGGGAPAGGVIGGAGRGAMPAGGVIGGAGAAGRGGAAGGGAGAMRANPAGGVIGGGAAGTRGGGVAGAGGVGGRGGAMVAGGGGAGGRAGAMGAGGMMGGAGGRPGQRRDGEVHDFDPDTEWDVAQGVTPVLDTPDAPDPIDPGPAIGLR